ncbi:MAG: hypothetical protein ACUZ8H_08980, partial [Candidatus Anammoxibacter sp.]
MADTAAAASDITAAMVAALGIMAGGTAVLGITALTIAALSISVGTIHQICITVIITGCIPVYITTTVIVGRMDNILIAGTTTDTIAKTITYKT